MAADDVDEEDRRPTQRRRLEEAQAGGFDEHMEPLVSAQLHNPDMLCRPVVALPLGMLQCAALLQSR